MNKYSIVSCASFGATGSGVVTDYLLEYPCINNFGDFEFRFLQDYSGISTLEDALVHNSTKLNSDTAIKNFIEYTNYQCGDLFSKRYEKFFKGKFKEYTNEFLNKIIDAQWNGYWEQYQVTHSWPITFVFYKLLPRFLRLLSLNRHPISRYLPKSTMYFSNPSKEYFYQCVKEYIHNLCSVIDPESRYKYIYLDQLMPPTNVARYFNYCESAKVIIVDRDPRDLYIENVLRFEEGWTPKDIDKYIVQYRGMRKKIENEPIHSDVLRLRFEDAIFHYEDFCERIKEFLQLEEAEHFYPKKYFDPAISIKNTQLWTKREVDMSLIKKIEYELGEYCYNF